MRLRGSSYFPFSNSYYEHCFILLFKRLHCEFAKNERILSFRPNIASCDPQRIWVIVNF
jgi:hypothetical protein